MMNKERSLPDILGVFV